MGAVPWVRWVPAAGPVAPKHGARRGGLHMLITAGIDVGSSAVKAAVVSSRAGADPAVLAVRAERIRRRELRKVIADCYAAALEAAAVAPGDVAYAASTGEGEMVEFRRGHFYGMTAHARGALFLEPEARAALDVGALHARAIRIDGRG